MARWLFHIDRDKRKQWSIVSSILILFILIYHLGSPTRPTPTQISSHSCAPNNQQRELIKPKDVKIIALVFFGRKSRVELLKYYIEKNLAENGGWLDEVHWVQNTENEGDLKFLDEILASSASYKKIQLSVVETGGFSSIWEHLERGSICIKVDDDIVWFADDTIPRMVTMKIQRPEYLLVSANVINSPLMGWVHYHMGVMHPYLPEYGVSESPLHGTFDETNLDKPRTSWHYQDHPEWKGPESYVQLDQDPPYDGHRWLRLHNETDIHRTPIVDIEYATWGTGLMSWAIAAQEHYSFLENLDHDKLDIYRFGRAWITDYQRLSINFVALWADEILENLPMDDVDEEWLTVNLPKKLGKSVAVDGDALAVHFSFAFQNKLGLTDLLERYHAYVFEKVHAQ